GAPPARPRAPAPGTLQTTPREPARHARIASVSAAARRYRPTRLARNCARYPPYTRAANETARTSSTAPITTPAVSEANARWDRACSDTVIPPLPRCESDLIP